MDQDVLNLALADQKEAEEKIEELRRQIEEEEQRIAQVASFVETYRSYEARAGQSQPAESTSGGGSYQPSSWGD